MEEVIILAICIIATSMISEAHFSKIRKPNLEIFKILQNQQTQDLQVRPINLLFDLESKESPQLERMKNKNRGESKQVLFRPNNEGVDTLTQDLLKRLKNLKHRDELQKEQLHSLSAIGKPNSNSYILLLAPNNNQFDNVLNGYGNNDLSDSNFVDETRTQNMVEPGSEVVFHIVPPKEDNKLIPKVRKGIFDFRSQYDIGRSIINRPQDRTIPPRNNRYYEYDIV